MYPRGALSPGPPHLPRLSGDSVLPGPPPGPTKSLSADGIRYRTLTSSEVSARRSMCEPAPGRSVPMTPSISRGPGAVTL